MTVAVNPTSYVLLAEFNSRLMTMIPVLHWRKCWDGADDHRNGWFLSQHRISEIRSQPFPPPIHIHADAPWQSLTFKKWTRRLQRFSSPSLSIALCFVFVLLYFLERILTKWNTRQLNNLSLTESYNGHLVLSECWPSAACFPIRSHHFYGLCHLRSPWTSIKNLMRWDLKKRMHKEAKTCLTCSLSMLVKTLPWVSVKAAATKRNECWKGPRMLHILKWRMGSLNSPIFALQIQKKEAKKHSCSLSLTSPVFSKKKKRER